MKNIEALETVQFGPGTCLKLSKEQAVPRARLLKHIEDGVYETLDNVQFKRGETFGFDGVLPKSLREIVLVEGKSEVPVIKPAPNAGGPVKFVLPVARDIPKPQAKAKG